MSEATNNLAKSEALLQYLHKSQRQKKFVKTKSKSKRTDSKDDGKLATSEELPDVGLQVTMKEDLKTKTKRREFHNDELNINKKISEAVEMQESESGAVLKTAEDFEHFNEVTSRLNELKSSNDKIYLTKAEKKCLEEITKFATKVRAPLDERQMMFYNKDCEKFSTPIDLKEIDEQCDSHVKEAAKVANESPSKIMTAELNTLVSYLGNLKSLIVKREMAWAASTENDYAQKAEIKRLKTEVENLRVVCTKRHNEIREKEHNLAIKEQELIRWQKFVQKLKSRLLVLEKENGAEEEEDEFGGSKQNRAKVVTKIINSEEPQKKSKLQMVEDALLAEARSRRGPVKKNQGRESGGDVRRNQGPAAMLANALYNARNEGNFIHF